jgi:pimeloyl-ACP methyl ester carboxylesterase
VRLHVDTPRGTVRGIAVVLHGGRETSIAAVRAHQLAVLRMFPFAGALRRAGSRDGLAVARLQYGVRGWNGAQRAPVADVEQALAELSNRFPNVPIALVGHSMGGRAAIYAAGHENVRAVVCLAPWIEQRDPVRTLAGRRVLIAHGEFDRVTDPRASAAYARAAAAYAKSVSYVRVAQDRHAMLRRAPLWHRLTAGFVLGVLFARDPVGDPGVEPNRVVREALAGQPALVV